MVESQRCRVIKESLYLLVCGQGSALPAITANSPILCRSRGRGRGERAGESRPLQARTDTHWEKGKGHVSGICLGQPGSPGQLIRPLSSRLTLRCCYYLIRPVVLLYHGMCQSAALTPTLAGKIALISPSPPVVCQPRCLKDSSGETP